MGSHFNLFHFKQPHSGKANRVKTSDYGEVPAWYHSNALSLSNEAQEPHSGAGHQLLPTSEKGDSIPWSHHRQAVTLYQCNTVVDALALLTREFQPRQVRQVAQGDRRCGSRPHRTQN